MFCEFLHRNIINVFISLFFPLNLFLYLLNWWNVRMNKNIIYFYTNLFLIFFFFVLIKMPRKLIIENFTKSIFFFILFFARNPNLKIWIRIVSFCIYLIITSVNLCFQFSSFQGIKKGCRGVKRCWRGKKKKKEDNKKLTRTDIPAFSSDM